MSIHKTNSHLNSLPLEGKEAAIKTTIRAFTLVELIVVITILAILGMIAFISLQGYSADARDSSRISDVNHIKTSLELQSLASGKYPLPDNFQDVTYSGGIVAWHQGTLGETVTKILSKNLNEKPTDPLYNTEYIYSVTPTQNQFEVLSIYEGDIVYLQNPSLFVNQPHPSQQEQPHPSQQEQPHPSPLLRGEGIEGGGIIETVNASSNIVRIDGNYNGVYVKNGNYIIPTPSIITSLNPAGLELDFTTIKSQVIDRGTNIPSIGTPKITQSTGALTFSTFEVYNGELNEESSTGVFLSAYQAIANTYSGSSLADEGVIKILLTQTTDEQKIEFTKSLVLSIPTGTSSSGDTGTTTYNCDETTKPTDNGYITYTTGTPTSANQTYVQDATNCGFTCTDGYTGTNCEIEPVQFLSNCSLNGQIYYADNTGNKLATVTNAGVATWVFGKSEIDLTCAGHIIICNGNNSGYILQACNSGANTLYTNQAFAGAGAVRDATVNTWAGGLYQWGNKADVSYTTTSTINPICTENSTFSQDIFINGNSYWCFEQKDNMWGGLLGTNIDRQGPCVTGYHVPTQSEWAGIITAGLWGTTGGTNMSNTIKMPTTGVRARSNGGMTSQLTYGYYWSSSPVGTNAYGLLFSSSTITSTANGNRAGGWAVRCVKN